MNDKGYEISSIDKVLQAVAECPAGEVGDLHKTISSSTVKADAPSKQPDFRSGLAQASAADLQAMSFTSALPLGRNLARSRAPSEGQRDHRYVDLHQVNEHGLPSREAMPPPAIPRHHHQSPQPAATPRSIKPASRLGQGLPTVNLPAPVLRSSRWTPTSHEPAIASRHFLSADVDPQSPPREITSDSRFPTSVTPQKRGHNGMAQEIYSVYERTPNRIRYGQAGEEDGNGSAFDLMNSPHKRATPGLYASEFSGRTQRDLPPTLSSNTRSELAGNGHIIEYHRDSSTPRATQSSAEHTRRAIPHDMHSLRHLRRGTSHASLESNTFTSPSTIRPTSFANSLQSFAFHGDPVNTYIEQRSQRKCPLAITQV